MVDIQNHIHLDTSYGGTPEFAPTTKYKVFVREPKHTAYVSINRALTARLISSTLLDISNDPVVTTDYQLVLKLTPAEIAVLRGKLGKLVYFCDSYHPDDGESHSAYRRTMFFSSMEEQEPANVKLVYVRTRIVLIDADTVA